MQWGLGERAPWDQQGPIKWSCFLMFLTVWGRRWYLHSTDHSPKVTHTHIYIYACCMHINLYINISLRYIISKVQGEDVSFWFWYVLPTLGGHFKEGELQEPWCEQNPKVHATCWERWWGFGHRQRRSWSQHGVAGDQLYVHMPRNLQRAGHT